MAQAQLIAHLRGDSSQFRAEINKAGASVNALKGFAASIGPQLAATFSVGAITAFARSVIELGDHIFDTAQKLGISTDEVQRLDYAAKQNGSSLDVFAKALLNAKRNAIEAERGSKQYAAALDTLGIKAKEIIASDPTEIALRFARALAEAKDNGRATAAIMDLLGRAGQELIPTLRGGEAAMREMFRDTPTMGEETVRKLKQISDAITLFTAEGKAAAAGPLAAYLDGFKIKLQGIVVAAAMAKAAVMALFSGRAAAGDQLKADLDDIQRRFAAPELTPVALTDDQASAVDEGQRVVVERQIAEIRQRQADIGKSDAELLLQTEERILELIQQRAQAASGSAEELEAEKQIAQARLERAQIQERIREREKRDADELARKQETLADMKFRESLRGLSVEEKIAALAEQRAKLEAEAAALRKEGQESDATDKDIEIQRLTSEINSLREGGARADTGPRGLDVVTSEARRVGGIGADSAMVFAGGNREMLSLAREQNQKLAKLDSTLNKVEQNTRPRPGTSGASWGP